MELKTFAEDDFDPKKWINKAWNSSSNQEKEVFVTNTVTRLQLYMKQLTNSLDETTTQRVTSMPRILQDASALQLEGSLLFQKLLSLEQKVESVEEQTGHSIESLQKIDTLKTRLENAASALREADKWAALANSLEDILESGVPTQADKLTELSQQVAAMTTSLEVLSDAPDYEAKRLQLETLYNRLEAAVTPPLLEALTKMDAERSGLYVRVFAGMSRSQSCARAGLRAAGARLASAWRSHPHHSHRALSRLLATEAPAQVDWLINVMKSEKPMSELVRLYTDLLLSLEPSPSKVVSANLKLCSTPDEGITMLTDLRSDIDDFVTSIKNIMNAPKQNKETVPHAVIVEFGRAAYLPLKELLPKYTESQTQMLTANVKEPSSSQDDLIEYSRTILSMTERCKSWLSSAYSSAVKIAGKAVYPYYIPAVEALLSKLSTYIASHSRHIESKFLSTITNGQPAGVLSTAFPAALVLESAAATLLETVAERQNIESLEDDDQNVDPLLDLPNLLLDSETQQRLSSLRSETLAPVLGLRRVKEQLRNLSRAILRSPIDSQLDKIPQLSVWNNNDALSTDLPDFSLSPQEYITEIGQYLMTLPQHLEMHLTDKQAPLQFLSEVCNHTCEVYAEKILNIRNMDALGTKRCLTDIVYLSSVVEDLGTSLTPSLKKLEKSLRAAAPAQNE